MHLKVVCNPPLTKRRRELRESSIVAVMKYLLSLFIILCCRLEIYLLVENLINLCNCSWFITDFSSKATFFFC